jgi:iron(III) transport system ATP-binding protein
MRAIVDSNVFLGLNTHYFVHLDSGEQVEIIQESKIDESIREKSEIYLTIKPEKINVFTQDGSKNIMKGVSNDSVTFAEA